MWQERVKIKGPYAFNRVIERLLIDPLNAIDTEQMMVKMPFDSGRRQMISVQSIGTKDDPEFIVRGSFKEDQEKVLNYVFEHFQWDSPLSGINQHFAQSSLSSIFEEHSGTPLVLESSVYSSLIKSIIHQQLNMAFASVLTYRFVTSFGERLEDVWFYPTPDVVASLKVEELRALQFSQRKAEYVIGVGERIVQGLLNVASFSSLEDEEIKKQLVSIRGVGPWTAENVLLFGLGRLNVFPMADIGIQNAIKKQFKMDRKPTIQEMELWSKEWNPYLSYASLYLWRSIETGK
ncbi:DNA-3-methyladenine glycosylase family protein [Jeotgalibacillus soli]|nr:DNA-3-methyladenine glycosylase [Jeotgalibacillus soli]